MNDDTISRQAAIDAFRKELCKEREYATPFISLNGCERILNELPSAERRGRWIYDERKGWCCSECGNQAPFWCLASTQNLTDYCPNCGAKMEGEEE